MHGKNKKWFWVIPVVLIVIVAVVVGSTQFQKGSFSIIVNRNPGLPDLQVQSYNADNATAMIQNTGKAKINRDFTALLEFFDDNWIKQSEQFVRFNAKAVRGLGSGNLWVLSYTKIDMDKIGFVRVTADINNEVKESNENNNSLTIDMHPKPDLQVQSIDPIKSTVTIQNTGNAVVKDFFSTRIQFFDPNNKQIGKDEFVIFNPLRMPGGIGVGALWNFSFLSPIPSDVTVIQVDADINNDINETSEINNQLRANI